MPTSKRTKSALMVLVAAAVLTAIFAGGMGAGLYFYPQVYPNATKSEADDSQAGHGHGGGHGRHDHSGGGHSSHAAAGKENHDDHLVLTKQAYDNLGLKLGTLRRGDYWKSILMPAEVVEIPGRSDLSVSAPVSGILESVNVLPGESIKAGATMFIMRMTDEALTVAQSKLLATLTKEEVVEQEIDRLAPLTRTGAVSGNRSRELKYDLKQLKAEQQTLIQELRGRGLPDSILNTVLEEKKLATTIEVKAPPALLGTLGTTTAVDGVAATDSGPIDSGPDPNAGFAYSVESLIVHPGKTVQRGDDLCSLAYHAQLYVEGTAFEPDLALLNQVQEKGWQLSAEFEKYHEDHTHTSERAQLDLLRIDNRVNEESQTVRFYVSLENEVERLSRDEADRVFQQWRFRPGQRIHLRLPVEHWTDRITLPAEAVVVDGPNAFVFAELKHDSHSDHDHSGHDHSGHDHGHDHAPKKDDSTFVELEPVPVQVLHRDDKTVILAESKQLGPKRKIAMNSGYKLHLAMKMKAGGGGGHGHDH